jgi:hypothetical protein
MDELAYSEGLEYLHCIYFDNGVDVRKTNQTSSEQSMFAEVLKLKEEDNGTRNDS